MSDIWSFLLQTLTASGAAAVLLAVKAMLRDKLSPRWQFAAWGMLALVLAVPAGLGGRYALVNWPLAVEFLRSLLTEEFGVLTRVSASVPLPHFTGLPRSGAEWAYAVYLTGTVFFLGRYAVSYLRLRLALRRGTPAGEARAALIRETAERYGLPVCPAVEVEGLGSAFICGVLRPVLALPAGEETDEKVLLHELLHLRHRDAAWGLLICLLRCVHWCNPLLWYCADLAGNDLESLCDQRALERLEGEDRRDYGRILLSMANEKYARTPGTSSMANGGKNIRRRIEAIARFKRYPAGMALVGVCAVLVLAGPCLVGARAQGVYTGGGLLPQRLRPYAAMASARTTPCTTYAGAFDTYAKAMLAENPVYLAMCTPLEDQDRLWISARMRRASGCHGWRASLWTGSPATGFTTSALWRTALTRDCWCWSPTPSRRGSKKSCPPGMAPSTAGIWPSSPSGRRSRGTAGSFCPWGISRWCREMRGTPETWDSPPGPMRRSAGTSPCGCGIRPSLTRR